MDSDGFYNRPEGLLAGFSASAPSAQLPELWHIGEQWAPFDFAIGWHEHAVWECYLQVDGSSHWQTETEEFALHPGWWYVVRPGVRHRLSRRPQGKHHYIFAEWAGLDCAQQIAADCAAAFTTCPDFIVGQGTQLHAPFRALVHEVLYAATWREQALRLACQQLTVAVARCLHPHEQNALMGGHEAVARCRQLIAQNLGQALKVEDLARMVGSSASHLSAVFTREVGQSIHQYVLYRRIEVAKQLLRDSDLQITQLALDLGFSSSQHFAKQFRRVVGMSARQWRLGTTL